MSIGSIEGIETTEGVDELEEEDDEQVSLALAELEEEDDDMVRREKRLDWDPKKKNEDNRIGE